MQADPGIQAILDLLLPTEASIVTEQPVASTSAVVSRTSVLTCEDESALVEALTALTRHLDGVPEPDDAAYLHDLAEADIDPSEFLQVAEGLSNTQLADLSRKEYGDLGELIAVSIEISKCSADPAQIFPKNVLKLYQRVSEPGIDIVSCDLDLSSHVSDRLTDADRMALIEVKTSSSSGVSGLAREAAASLNNITIARVQRELRLIQAGYMDGQHSAAASRVRFFLAAYRRRSANVASRVVMLCPEPSDPSASLGVSSLDVVHLAESLEVRACFIDVEHARSQAYAHRRGVA